MFRGKEVTASAALKVIREMHPNRTYRRQALRKKINECAGDMQFVYNKLNLQGRDPLSPGGSPNPDGKKWTDPVLRQAEKFATAAALNSVDYTAIWGAHNTAGIWFYQCVWKPLKQADHSPTTPVSDDAFGAGNAGAYFYQKPPSVALKWCDSCGSH